MKKTFLSYLAITCFLLVFACNENETTVNSQENTLELADQMTKVDISVPAHSAFKKTGNTNENDLFQRIAQINDLLLAYDIQIEKMEYLSYDDAGNEVFFSDRGNKQLASDYVPNDPRSLFPGSDVPYLIDGTQLNTASGLNILNTTQKVMNTWDQVVCSDGLSLPFLGVTSFDAGFVSNLLGFGGTEGFFPGVIVHAGILPFDFFEAIRPGGGRGI